MALTPNEAYAAKQPFVDKETLEHIVEQFPTPFHLYDEAGIRRNMQEVRDAFAWNLGFKEYFAVKANPNPALISILNEYGCGCDCSSYTELMIARSLGITGHDIMFSSNDTPAADFELADKLGAIVNFDDISHIEFFERVAGAIPKTVSCRFNPGGLFQLSNGIMDNPGRLQIWHDHRAALRGLPHAQGQGRRGLWHPRIPCQQHCHQRLLPQARAHPL